MKVMTGILRKLAISAAVTLLGVGLHADEVLLWMIDDPDIVGNYGVIQKATDIGENASYARIAVINNAADYTVGKGFNDGTSDHIYLSLYNNDTGSVIPQDFVDLYHTDGTFDGTTETPLYALMRESQGCKLGIGTRLAIELGYWNGEGDTLGEWIVAATSSLWDYDEIFHNYALSQVDPHVQTPWTGGAFASPEPTSGLLMLLGGALLALRRRKNLVSEEV